MTYTKTIVCLANSRKPPSGRCIAGREIDPDGNGSWRFGSWIRPVSARPTQEISEEERKYEDGVDPKILDIISIKMSKPHPQRHQQENHLIDDQYYWEKNGILTWVQIQNAIENPAGTLWINNYSSSHGCNDRVPDNLLQGLKRSLYLVQPQNLILVVAPEGGDFGPPRRRIRASFNLCDYNYCIVVTDPKLEKEYFAKPNGKYELNESLLCISLGEVFNGYAYKLAASVLIPYQR